MRSLRDLLSTWENWSAREVNRQALDRANSEAARAVMRRAIDRTDDIDPLDVLEDTAELVNSLLGWRWQVVRAARGQGASWERIGEALGVSGRQAKADYEDRDKSGTALA